MEKYDVIFVCHGNVNRSKMAEFYMKMIHPELSVDSFAAGLKSKAGVLITKKTRTVLEENKVPFDPQTRSKLLTPEVCKSARNIFVMDMNNIIHYIDKYGDGQEMKFKLLAGGMKKIKDPGFSKGMDKYYEVFEQIKEGCNNIQLT